MKTLNDAMREMVKISGQIEKLLYGLKYYDYDDLSGLEFTLDNPNQIQLWEEMRGIVDQLHRAKTDIDYMNRPILADGILRQNGNGRYEAGGREFTSGSVLEALIDDGRYDCPHWVVSRIEHDGTRYYLYGYKNIVLDGLKVRFR